MPLVRQQSSGAVEDFYYRIPQFIYELKRERIIEIGPHLPKLSLKSGMFFMAHGVCETALTVIT